LIQLLLYRSRFGLGLRAIIAMPTAAHLVGVNVKLTIMGAFAIASALGGIAGYLVLAVIAVLNSAVAAYYYLRVIVYMYMEEPAGAAASWTPSFAGGVALAIALLGVVLLGVMPAPFVDLAQAAVAPLLR